jgi:NAD(P)-dependent dehydrogenase (short-subunit alcohol dehydrogenase family)
MKDHGREQKASLVTGSSTGIGFETSIAAARNRFYTYATMHKLQNSDIIIEIARREQLPQEVFHFDVNNDN